MKYKIDSLSKNTHLFTLQESFFFESGHSVSELMLVYETYGVLSENRDNVVVIHHALSTNSHVTSLPDDAESGWWDNMVGPGKPINTDKFFVICINNLGSCFGSSGPTSLSPETHQPYRMTFPHLTIDDIAVSQNLLLEALGINKLHAVVGPSMGGMISLAFCLRFPEKVERLLSISSCCRSYPNNIAIRSIQREIIRLDPQWQEGFYNTNELPGFRLARKFGHMTYRSAQEFNHRFDWKKNSDAQKQDIHSYLEYNANKFIQQFDANSYLYLTQAMDHFNVLSGHSEAVNVFKTIQAKVLIISVESDTLFSPFQQEELFGYLVAADVDCELIRHPSQFGHDAFLVETNDFGRYITPFLEL